MLGFVIGDRGLGTAGETHPAWMMAHAIAGPYLVVGASAIGHLHLYHQTPRDDAFVIRCVDPWLAVVVSDGVGSRPFSRYGATYVAEVLSAYLLQPFTSLASLARGGPEQKKQGREQGESPSVPPDHIEEPVVDFQPRRKNQSKYSPSKLIETLFPRSKAEEPDLDQISQEINKGLVQISSIGWNLNKTASLTATSVEQHEKISAFLGGYPT